MHKKKKEETACNAMGMGGEGSFDFFFPAG
jgi:hypothetical protein